MRHTFVAVIPPIPTPSLATAVPAPLAADRDLTEDEWEWEIAVARARASADDTELVARVAPRVSAPAPQPVAAAPRTRLETVPPSPSSKFVSSHVRTLPGVAPISKPITANAFPTPEPVPASRDSWTAAQAQLAELETTRVDVKAPEPIRALPRASSPHTVIPVPKLPTLASARMIDPQSSWIEPVVRKTMPTPIPPRRLAKGTGPIDSESTSTKIPHQDQTNEAFSADDHTVETLISPVAATMSRVIPSIKRTATRG